MIYLLPNETILMYDLLPSFMWVLLLGTGLLGILIGSFLNSFLWRLHSEFKIHSRRSICVHCNRQLSWWENIPLVSFIILQGRCRSCHGRIPWHYPLVELSMSVLFVISTWLTISQHSDQHLLLAYIIRDLIFTTLLISIFIYDGLYSQIPLSILVVGCLVGIIANLLLPLHSFPSLCAAVLLGGGFFLLQFIISRGAWIGAGDIYLGVMMGIWLGWPAIIIALFCAYILGALYAGTLIIFKKKERGSTVPFGTFLTIGTFIALYWGKALVAWYLTFL